MDTLESVNEVCEFGAFSNRFTGYSKQCNSLAAYIYYVHVLQDCIADKGVMAVTDKGISNYVSDDIIILGGADKETGDPNGVPDDMIDQLIFHFGILFPRCVD